MTALRAAVAATRFGLGARPGEIDAARGDPAGWLMAQWPADPQPLAGVPTTREALMATRAYLEDVRGVGQGELTPAEAEQAQARVRAQVREPRITHVLARTRRALEVEGGFAERWIRFWSNHFSVSGVTAQSAIIAPTLEADAIRRLAFSSFETMLVGVELHPAMLIYLDNQASIGPNSRAGRFSGRGLNENLAREILELHTLGVDGGYAQADVEALARILTGWTIGRPRLHDRDELDRAIFDPRFHEPGAQTLLGRRFRGDGPDKARDALRFLAERPQTRAFVSRKLAAHFIADAPAPEDVAHIEAAWEAGNGDLKRIAEAVITAPGAFDPEPRKFKTPEEFLISALRSLDLEAPEPRALLGSFQALGQIPFSAPSPAGWPDDEASWAGADAIMKRLEYANALSARFGPRAFPRERAESALGARLSEATRVAIARAQTPEQGLTLLLMSPEFQRR